jgi:hypothetical protein
MHAAYFMVVGLVLTYSASAGAAWGLLAVGPLHAASSPSYTTQTVGRGRTVAGCNQLIMIVFLYVELHVHSL